MDPKVIYYLLLGAQEFQKNKDLKEFERGSRLVFCTNLALWLGLDIKEIFKDEEAFLNKAIELLKEIQKGQPPPPNIPPNLEELQEQMEEAKRKHQAFLKKEGGRFSPKEQIEIWIEKQKEIYQQRKIEKATEVTAEKIRAKRTYQVVIPQERKKTEKEEEETQKATEAVEKLKKWIEKGFVQNLPFLQQNLELRHGMTAAVEKILKVYLPELTPKELKKISSQKLEKIARTCENAVIDALALPIADQVIAEGKEIGPDAIKQIIENLTPSAQFPQSFAPLLPILTLSREERFPEEKYGGPEKVSLEEAEGGLPVLFIPEKVQAAVLKVLTYPLVSTITENPETAFSLIDPETGSPIREKIRQLITNKGITPISYNTLKLFTAEVRSLRLLCAGITPEILLQTIEKQKEKGIKETDPVIKILRMLHDDLGEFEKKIGFPIKLIEAWARVRASISKPHQPLEVGTQEVYPAHQPEKLYQGTRARIRTEWLKRGIKKIYCLQAQAGEKVRVENRLLRPITRPIRFIYRRAFQPILIRLGRTTLGRTIKLGWSKVKGAAAKAFWRISKEGFKKVAGGAIKKAGSWLATKLGLTAITTILGTPIAGALTFIASTVLPWLAKKAVRLVTWPFRALKNFFFGKERRGQKAVDGFSGLMEWMTSGAWIEDWRWLKWVLIGTLVILPFLGFFIDEIETKADFLSSLVPTETRYLGPPEDLPGRIPMASQELSDIFAEAADKYCVPIEMLLAISQMEASGVWSYDNKEVAKFSTHNPPWWEEAGCDLNSTTKPSGDCGHGYCYDTCKVTNLCPSYSVVGPMQFEKGTWNGYIASLRTDFEKEGNPHEPHRCNLRDSIFAAAMKIKANSGTGDGECSDWNEETVRRTARAYCGSCGIDVECGENPTPECEAQNQACGVAYCEAVVMLYNEYK